MVDSLGIFLALVLVTACPPSVAGPVAEWKGELTGPTIIKNRRRERVLEYKCLTLTKNDGVRSIRMRLRPKGRAMTVYLGEGVTVEGTAHRTRLPKDNLVFYTLTHTLEHYRFKLVFSTDRSGTKAQLRLVSDKDAIDCGIHPPDNEFPAMAD